MPRQLELEGRPPLTLAAARDRISPRVWIRRLIIWSEPGVKVREVVLRRGLNIIWSPDATDDVDDHGRSGTIGHGSGKTLFCRLLRYCLGEDSFAPEEQRYSIAGAFPRGAVGAEIVVHNDVWAVARPFGHDGRSVASKGSLDELDVQSQGALPYSDFVSALDTRILDPKIATAISGERTDRAWPICLAWLSRDQECRLSGLTNWRSADSDSRSPARRLSTTEAVEVIRVLVGADSSEERRLREEIDVLKKELDEVGQRDRTHLSHLDQALQELARRLGLSHGLPTPSPLVVEQVKAAVNEELKRTTGVWNARVVEDISALRTKAAEAQDRVRTLGERLAEIRGQLPLLEKLISKITGELPGLSFRKLEAEQPVCLTCEVPIDRILAEGCKLSHKLPDLEAIRKRHSDVQNELQNERTRVRDLENESVRLDLELKAATAEANAMRDRISTIDRARDSGAEAWHSTRRLTELLADVEAQQEARGKASVRMGDIRRRLEEKIARADALRARCAKSLTRLSEIFDGIARAVVGEHATGEVKLDGNGLHPIINLDGDRKTPAMKSLTIVAFDLNDRS